jgi:hypothetical protein
MSADDYDGARKHLDELGLWREAACEAPWIKIEVFCIYLIFTAQLTWPWYKKTPGNRNPCWD